MKNFITMFVAVFVFMTGVAQADYNTCSGGAEHYISLSNDHREQFLEEFKCMWRNERLMDLDDDNEVWPLNEARWTQSEILGGFDDDWDDCTIDDKDSKNWVLRSLMDTDGSAGNMNNWDQLDGVDGVIVSFEWKELETEIDGTYQFEAVHAVYDELERANDTFNDDGDSSLNQDLIIKIDFRNYDNSGSNWTENAAYTSASCTGSEADSPLPGYFTDGTHYETNQRCGQSAFLWKGAVANELVDLIDALYTEFPPASYPYIKGLLIQEIVPGLGSYDAGNTDNLLNNLGYNPTTFTSKVRSVIMNSLEDDAPGWENIIYANYVPVDKDGINGVTSSVDAACDTTSWPYDCSSAQQKRLSYLAIGAGQKDIIFSGPDLLPEKNSLRAVQDGVYEIYGGNYVGYTATGSNTPRWGISIQNDSYGAYSETDDDRANRTDDVYSGWSGATTPAATYWTLQELVDYVENDGAGTAEDKSMDIDFFAWNDLWTGAGGSSHEYDIDDALTVIADECL